MKKVLLILALCLLILCGCGQGEPVATVPTETAAPTEAPTQASTEAPTEPRELTDEEKKQLHYEQVFAEGSYVIDWSCVNINVNDEYLVELYSDENGIFWEELKTCDGFPEYEVSHYFRPDENHAYLLHQHINEIGIQLYHVSPSSPRQSVVSDAVLAARLLFEDCLDHNREIWYVETADGLDVVAIDSGLLRGCMLYIDPATRKIQKMDIYDADSVLDEYRFFNVEFADKSVTDITEFDNLPPIPVSGTLNFDSVAELQSSWVRGIKHYWGQTFDRWSPTLQLTPKALPTTKVIEESQETIAEKQKKWEQVFTNQEYIMDWDNVKIDWQNATHCELLTDAQGVFWTMYGSDANYFPSYNICYQADENHTYFYTTPSLRQVGEPRWYMVDTSSKRPEQSVVLERAAFLQSVLSEYLTNTQSIRYEKTIAGFDVVKINGTHFGYGSGTLTFYMNPDTLEVNYIFSRYGSSSHYEKIEFVYYSDRTDIHMDRMDAIHQVRHYFMYPAQILTLELPENIAKTVTFDDMERCNDLLDAMGFDLIDSSDVILENKYWETEGWITGEPYIPGSQPWYPDT